MLQLPALDFSHLCVFHTRNIRRGAQAVNAGTLHRCSLCYNSSIQPGKCLTEIKDAFQWGVLAKIGAAQENPEVTCNDSLTHLLVHLCIVWSDCLCCICIWLISLISNQQIDFMLLDIFDQFWCFGFMEYTFRLVHLCHFASIFYERCIRTAILNCFLFDCCSNKPVRAPAAKNMLIPTQ